MANITIRMTDSDKDAFSKFCDEIGISVSSAFNIFAKKVIREQRIPFEMKVDPFYSEENVAVLKESLAQLNSGKYVIHDIKEN